MKEKKIFKIENENAKKNPNRNYIEYYVNPEKRVVTAVLTGVRQEMMSMFEKKCNQYGFSARGDLWQSFDALYDAVKTIPIKITASATCAPEDEFDTEVGCNIARMRLLQKLYYYREKVACILSANIGLLDCLLSDYEDFCSAKQFELEDTINDVIAENEK